MPGPAAGSSGSRGFGVYAGDEVWPIAGTDANGTKRKREAALLGEDRSQLPAAYQPVEAGTDVSEKRVSPARTVARRSRL